MLENEEFLGRRRARLLAKCGVLTAAVLTMAACDLANPVDTGNLGAGTEYASADADETDLIAPGTDPVSPAPTTVEPEADEPNQGAAENVIFNGTFENGLSGWTQVEPATGSQDPNTGLGAGKVEDGGSISQPVFVEPNATYELTAQIKGTATLGVNIAGVEQTTTVSNEDYAEFELTVETAEALEVVLSIEADEIARIDDVELVKVAGGTPSAAPVDPNSVFDFEIWETEGRNPIDREGKFVFDALAERVLTPNGNGFRHEMKIRIPERVGLTEQYERFFANIELDLSDGSETIAAQHHPEGLGTLTALYIRDSEAPPGAEVENGVALDGIFDVYVTIRKPDGSGNDIVVLGTVKDGENFNYEVINNRGDMTMVGLGTTATVKSADSSASYFKFGNYLQARDPSSLERVSDRGEFGAFYADQKIERNRLTFRNVSYERIVY